MSYGLLIGNTLLKNDLSYLKDLAGFLYIYFISSKRNVLSKMNNEGHR